MTLLYIVIATLAGGLLSVLIAARLTVSLLARVVKNLVSLSAGVLLATALLHVLPEAFEGAASPQHLFATLLGGLMFFFLLEKAELYRHTHHHEGDGHHHHHHFDEQQAGQGGWSVLVGDSIHNFCDGIIIAAAFLTDVQLGVVTSLAIIAHEIPQEVGDYLILLHSGYSRIRALAFNLLSSLATLIGALLAYFALSQLTEWIPYLLGLAAASMIYVAVADLIPGLHKRTELKATLQQILLIGLGVASIAGVRALVGE